MKKEREKLYNERLLTDERILAEVISEMNRQIKICGIQTHSPLVWNAILVEEVGEVSKAILETLYQDKPRGTVPPDEYRKELIHVAAVAISAIRAIDWGHVPI